jgi:hypothetical protein
MKFVTGLKILVRKSNGVGMAIFLLNRMLKVRPVMSNVPKAMISLHHFFFKRGGISNREITAPINKIPMIAPIDHYSPISF